MSIRFTLTTFIKLSSSIIVLAAFAVLTKFIAQNGLFLMKKIFIATLIACVFISCDLSKYKLNKEYDLETLFEKSGGTQTSTYSEIIKYYEELDESFTSIQLEEYGQTDSGEPLHLAIFNPSENFNLEEIREDYTIILINNGIHPGESDGIDATMMLFRNLAQDSIPIPTSPTSQADRS